MTITCNINARGKAVRLVYGMIMVTLAILVSLLWAWGTESPVRWGVCVALFAFGVFGIFEGWAGWCVVRAMGFKTPV